MKATNMRKTAVVLLAGMACAGCVMPDKVTEMQKDLSDIRSDLQQIRASQDDALQRLETLEAKSSDDRERITKADLADVNVNISQLARDVGIVDERLNDMGRRIDRLSQQVQQAREANRPGGYGAVPVPTDEPGLENVNVTEGGAAAAGADMARNEAQPDPEELYNTAYADFSKGNYALAISGFEEYHEKFPGSALADNALYWVGECHFSQGDFPEAIKAFDRMLDLYASSDKAAAANLKKGLAYLEQNEVGLAIVQLRYVVSEYPGSDEAKIAKDKLTSLGAPT
jgi:tol-pal system protein YbgF